MAYLAGDAEHLGFILVHSGDIARAKQQPFAVGGDWRVLLSVWCSEV
jgi:hypothetical protein